MHKLESDLLNLAVLAEKKGAKKLAKKLTSLASASHYYVPDPSMSQEMQDAVATGKPFPDVIPVP